MKLEQLVKALETKIVKEALQNNTVSKVPVGWHIEHTLLSINGIIERLKSSNEAKYQWKFKLIRTIVFTIGKIPRGRAQTPSRALPNSNFNEASLRNHIELTLKKLPELESLKANNFIEHPVFGILNLKLAIKFLEIHTRHHLDIIDDIIGKAE